VTQFTVHRVADV